MGVLQRAWRTLMPDYASCPADICLAGPRSAVPPPEAAGGHNPVPRSPCAVPAPGHTLHGSSPSSRYPTRPGCAGARLCGRQPRTFPLSCGPSFWQLSCPSQPRLPALPPRAARPGLPAQALPERSLTPTSHPLLQRFRATGASMVTQFRLPACRLGHRRRQAPAAPLDRGQAQARQ